jgi:hypothetical protein
MHEAQGHIEVILRDAAFGTPRRPTRPIASSITALEGHDLPQPCQVGQCAYEFLGRSVRTASELRMLQFVRSASVRLGDQFDALVTALLCKYTSQVKLTPVPVGPLLRQTIFENEFVVQTKGSAFAWPGRAPYCERRAPSRYHSAQPGQNRREVRTVRSPHSSRSLSHRRRGRGSSVTGPDRLRYKAIPLTRSNV